LNDNWSTWGSCDFAGGLESCTLSWKIGFIKDNVAGKIDLLRMGFKAPVATLIGNIAEKDAGLASKGKFMCCIRAKKRIIEATKGAEESVIRIFLE
jgi:hypothetical protein